MRSTIACGVLVLCLLGFATGSAAGTETTPTIAAVSAGGQHTCALATDGTVYCWGDNEHDQLGHDTLDTFSDIPQQVSGLSGITAISAGGAHTCALTSAGGVECWGDNEYGQLGDGTTTSSETPVQVSGLGSDVVAISAGSTHTCALIDDGTVECWGDNTYGELGDGTTTSSSIPVFTGGFKTFVTEITSGFGYSCATLSDGSAYCWGRNFVGELGDGTTTDRAAPVAVQGLSGGGVVTVSASDFYTCALMSGGGVECWGNDYLGFNTTAQSMSGMPSGIVALGVGHGYGCVLTGAGTVKCWGGNDDNGVSLLGDGTNTSTFTPQQVVGLTSGVTQLSVNSEHACALQNGTIECWGFGISGERGDGTTNSGPTPTAASFDNNLSIAGHGNITAVQATGPSGAVVTFTAPTASDDGESVSVGCSPASGSTFPVGTTTVTCTATDSDDAPGSASTTFTVQVVDADLTLTNVPANKTVDATGPSGAVVTYTKPGVSDEETPLPSVTCSPASGSTFAIGTTTVNCSATDGDDSNSPATASFTVTVRGAAQELQSLQTFAMTLPPGTSLLSKIQLALTYYQAGNKAGACSELSQVISEAKAQSGKHLTVAQANQVIAAATQIRAVIGC